jgi:predicted nucleic acid-binding protein
VVVNATPIISLSLIDRLDLLDELYPRVVIPSAVHREVVTGGKDRPGVISLESSPWIEVRDVEDPGRAALLSDLDRGEAEVIATAQELSADLVILDERLGRRHARRLGLALTGTLGVLLRAKREGMVSELGPFVEKLRVNGIWLGDALVREALRLSGESN